MNAQGINRKRKTRNLENVNNKLKNLRFTFAMEDISDDI